MNLQRPFSSISIKFRVPYCVHVTELSTLALILLAARNGIVSHLRRLHKKESADNHHHHHCFSNNHHHHFNQKHHHLWRLYKWSFWRKMPTLSSIISGKGKSDCNGEHFLEITTALSGFVSIFFSFDDFCLFFVFASESTLSS